MVQTETIRNNKDFTCQTDKLFGTSSADCQTENIIQKVDNSGAIKQFRDFAIQT